MVKRFLNYKRPTMQQSIFEDLTQILPYLANLDQKIANLQLLGKWISDSKVEIFATKHDGTVHTITQEIIPFKLEIEMKTLVDDSIDELQRQRDHLQKLLDETNR